MTSARLRPLAASDLTERTRYYRRDGGDDVGERSFESAISALRAIEQMPAAGSSRIGEICGIAGLRVRRVVGFPCGWFYFIAPDHVDVVRLLADAQDLPTILAGIDQEE